MTGRTCGDRVEAFEGCADGVGGSVYLAGSGEVRSCTFRNSSLPNAPLELFVGLEKFEPVVTGAMGLDVFSRGRIHITNTTFLKSADSVKFTSVAPRSAVLTCDALDSPCGEKATCTMDTSSSLSAWCTCEGAYASPDTDPYTTGCILQDLGSTITIQEGPRWPDGRPINITWTWQDTGLQGAADAFKVWKSTTRGGESGYTLIATVPGTNVQDSAPSRRAVSTILVPYDVPHYFRVQAVVGGIAGSPVGLQSPVLYCSPGTAPFGHRPRIV